MNTKIFQNTGAIISALCVLLAGTTFGFTHYAREYHNAYMEGEYEGKQECVIVMQDMADMQIYNIDGIIEGLQVMKADYGFFLPVEREWEEEDYPQEGTEEYNEQFSYIDSPDRWTD